jgi:hypothetical protein
LSEDTKTAEKDPKFYKVMFDLYSELMEPTEDKFDESCHQDFQLVFKPEDRDHGSAGSGMLKAFTMLPSPTRAQVLELIPKIVGNKQVVLAIDEVVSLANKAGGTVVMVGLAAVYLAWDVVKNIRRCTVGRYP